MSDVSNKTGGASSGDAEAPQQQQQQPPQDKSIEPAQADGEGSSESWQCLGPLCGRANNAATPHTQPCD
jgi:hypothetical protein